MIGCVLSLPLADGIAHLQIQLTGDSGAGAFYYTYNAHGLRGPVPNPKVPAQQRTAIIGDSVAMGWHVPEPQTLRARLEARLGPKSDVITTGYPGLNLDEAVTRWLSYSRRIPVGTVVLVATIRAPGQSLRHKGSEEPDRTLPPLLAAVKDGIRMHSVLYAELCGILRKYQTKAEIPLTDKDYMQPWHNQARLAEVHRALDRLQADQEKHHYRVIILIMPDLYSFHPYLAGIMHETMRREARDRGWTCIDPMPAMENHPARSYRVSDDFVHPNPTAINIMTDQLIRAFPGGGHG